MGPEKWVDRLGIQARRMGKSFFYVIVKNNKGFIQKSSSESNLTFFKPFKAKQKIKTLILEKISKHFVFFNIFFWYILGLPKSKISKKIF